MMNNVASSIPAESRVHFVQNGTVQIAVLELHTVSLDV